MAQHWYVIQVKQHQERLVAAVLQKKGLATYVPHMIQWPRPAVGSNVVPLFPGYVFVRATLPEDYYEVAWAIGVKHFVTCGDEPTTLPEEAIDFLKSKQSNDGLVHVGAARPGNRMVRIARGPFEGLQAVVERRLNSRDRVVVLIEFLQRQTQVELPEKWLRQA